MKQQGNISRWQDDKGFGFIKTDSQEYFFHISQYRANTRPVLGEAVVFDIGKDKQGKPCAVQVQQAEFVRQKVASRNAFLQRQQARDASEKTLSTWVILAVMFLVIVMAATQKFTWLILGWYLVISLVTFAVYAKDKASAQHNARRTPEQTLHQLAVLGGWVGATFAHKWLKHKSSKASFRQTFYITIMVNMGLFFMFVYWLYSH